MKGVAWGIVLALAVLAVLAAPARAGTVYRCESPDGTRAYASKRVPGARCVVAGQYTGKERRKAPSAAGSATVTAAVTGSPASLAAAPLAPAAGSIPPVSRSTVPASVPVASAPAPVATVTPAGSTASRAGGAPRRLVQGQVYSYIKHGVRHYSSRPPKGVAGATALRTIKYSFMETCYACGVLPGVNLYGDPGTLAAEFSLPEHFHSDPRSPVRWITSHTLRHWMLGLVLLVGAFGNAALAAAVPVLAGRAFNAVLANPPEMSILLNSAILIVISQIVRAFFQFARNFSAELIGQRLERDIRDENYISLIGKSMTFHSLQPVGDTMARTTNDVREINLLFRPRFKSRDRFSEFLDYANSFGSPL